MDQNLDIFPNFLNLGLSSKPALELLFSSESKFWQNWKSENIQVAAERVVINYIIVFLFVVFWYLEGHQKLKCCIFLFFQKNFNFIEHRSYEVLRLQLNYRLNFSYHKCTNL